MRTTLTVDDDLVAELQRRAHETGRSFKAVVNEALRSGLYPPTETPRIDVNYPTSDLGRADVDLVRARHLADALEDEAIARKLELRK